MQEIIDETTIRDYLRTSYGARLVDGRRWLYWDDIECRWVVREHPYRKRKAPVMYAGKHLHEALDILKGE